MITKEQHEYLYEDLLHPLDYLWSNIKHLFDMKPGDSCPDNFSHRRNMFLYVLHQLILEGRLKLAKKGKLLDYDIDKQVAMFRDAFPDNDDEIDMGVGGAATWFYTDTCPAGAVWVLEDGSLYWT